MTDQRAPSRLLLLLLLLVGVTGMHTVGHPVGEHDHGQTPHLAGSLFPLAYVGSATGHAATHTTNEHAPRLITNPLDACAAVLVSGQLLWLIAALMPARPVTTDDRHATAGHPSRGRGPPRSPLLGLTIADLSVQRT